MSVFREGAFGDSVSGSMERGGIGIVVDRDRASAGAVASGRKRRAITQFGRISRDDGCACSQVLTFEKCPNGASVIDSDDVTHIHVILCTKV